MEFPRFLYKDKERKYVQNQSQYDLAVSDGFDEFWASNNKKELSSTPEKSEDIKDILNEIVQEIKVESLVEAKQAFKPLSEQIRKRR